MNKLMKLTIGTIILCAIGLSIYLVYFNKNLDETKLTKQKSEKNINKPQTEKTNHYNQESFENPFNKITKGMEKQQAIALTGESYKSIIGAKDENQLVDIYYFKSKEFYYRIVFSKNKVIGIFRYEDDHEMKSR